MTDNQDDKLANNRILWGIIQRHPDYIRFCKNCKFDKEGYLITTDENIEDTEKIKQRFKILMILDPGIEANEYHLTNLFNTATRAVTSVSYGVDDLPETHIRVDIDVRAPFSEIVKDLKYWLRLRKITDKVTKDLLQKNLKNYEHKLDNSYFIKKFKPEVEEITFKVWDLHQEGMTNHEIAEKLWPGEYEKAKANIGKSLDDKYKELFHKYKRAGIKDCEERAYNETYGENTEIIGGESEKYRLLKRVEDKKSRMLELFKIY